MAILQLTSPGRTLTRIINTTYPLGGSQPGLDPQDLETLDWEAVAYCAEEKKLAPLLHEALKSPDLAAARVPDTIRERLRRRYHQTFITNRELYIELEALLDIFEQEAIPVVLLKGCALAETIYNNIALRPMSDLDLLIHKPDLPRMSTILTGRGFALEAQAAPGIQEDMVCELYYLRRGAIDVAIEPHWHVFHLPYYAHLIPVEWFWQRTAPITIRGRKARMLASGANLLHLTSHLALHKAGLWLQSYDIARWLARQGDEIDWNEVLEQARAIELLPSFQELLMDIAEIWNVKLPDQAQLLLARGQRRYSINKFMNIIATTPNINVNAVIRLFGAKGYRRKLSYLRELLFPPFTYMRKRYKMQHKLLAPLYYAYRLGMLGIRGSLLLIDMVRNSNRFIR